MYGQLSFTELTEKYILLFIERMQEANKTQRSAIKLSMTLIFYSFLTPYDSFL